MYLTHLELQQSPSAAYLLFSLHKSHEEVSVLLLWSILQEEQKGQWIPTRSQRLATRAQVYYTENILSNNQLVYLEVLFDRLLPMIERRVSKRKETTALNDLLPLPLLRSSCFSATATDMKENVPQCESLRHSTPTKNYSKQNKGQHHFLSLPVEEMILTLQLWDGFWRGK